MLMCKANAIALLYRAASSDRHDKIVEMFVEGQYTQSRRLEDYSNLFTVRTST